MPKDTLRCCCEGWISRVLIVLNIDVERLPVVE